jgi:hypothetical protein
VGLLVAIAVVISAVLMAGLTAQAVMARTNCNDRPLVLNVAVSPDIAPAIQRVGQLFNKQSHVADGRCVITQISPEDPATVASVVDGQATSDAWIPDSSLWVDVARSYPLGAQQVQTTGITAARSPLMIVMPAAAAAQVPAFNNNVGWNFLVPTTAGGPPGAQQVRVELPDPTQSAAGLAALVEVGRLRGTLSAPPLDAHPVTVTTEQAVVSYDALHQNQPLAARYPTGGSAALGAPELNYPFVITSTKAAEQTAADEFGKLLQQSYTAQLVRYYGFRSANGVTGTLPARDGIAQQPLQLAPAAAPSEAQTALAAWRRLQVGSRDLAVMDVSSATGAPSGLGTLTLGQILKQTAQLGLELFPDSAQLGLWEFSDKLDGSLPYKQLVSVGPLPGELGLISRREQILQVDGNLQTQTNAPAALNQTILAAYKQMTASYQTKYTNAVIMLTAGVDNAPGDISAAALVRKLHGLFNPNKPVELIILMLGSKGNFPALERIATAGGGAAYQVTNPTQVGKVFFEAVARRFCLSGGCAG